MFASFNNRIATMITRQSSQILDKDSGAKEYQLEISGNKTLSRIRSENDELKIINPLFFSSFYYRFTFRNCICNERKISRPSFEPSKLFASAFGMRHHSENISRL